MLRNQSGVIKHALLGANGNRQTFASDGNEVTFSMASLPKSDGRGKAYYLAGLVLEISGIWTNGSGSAKFFSGSKLIRGLVGQLNLRDTAMGSPISSTAWKDYAIKNASFIGSGYSSGAPTLGQSVADAGTCSFTVRIPLPLCLGLNVAPAHTAQLAVLYRNGTFGVTPKSDSGSETVFGVGALTSGTCQLTALLVPSGELLHGPAVEMMDYTTAHPAAANHQHTWQDFGNKSGFTGVESGAGIAWLVLMGALEGAPGVSLATLTRVGVPFRNQPDISDPMAFMDEAYDALDSAAGRIGFDNSLIAITGASAIPSGRMGYPYSSDATETSDGPSYNYGFYTPWCLPLVSPGRDLKLTKIQVVDEAVTLTRQHSAATAAGSAVLLAWQLKSWTPQMREQWRQAVIASGLAEEVLGSKNVKWGSVKTLGKPSANAKRSKLRMLPMKLVAA